MVWQTTRNYQYSNSYLMYQNRMSKQPVNNQHGIALITAMLVVAIASIVTIEIVHRQQIDIRRTRNLIDHDQAYFYARGAEIWMMLILKRDASENNTDSGNDIWANLIPPLNIEGGTLSLSIEDLQGRYNLNNLVQSGKRVDVEFDRLQRLFDVIGLDPALVHAVVDWIDPNINTSSVLGAEDGEYLKLDPPYRAANMSMSSVTELRLVRGITRQVYDQLIGFVTALPEPTTINVNTATVEVLMTLE